MKAFQPQGNTITIAGNSTAPAGVLCLGDGNNACTWYRVGNPDSVNAWYAYGESAEIARTRAVVPTSGNSVKSMLIPPAAIEVICAPPRSFFSAVTSSGNANVQITAGEGF